MTTTAREASTPLPYRIALIGGGLHNMLLSLALLELSARPHPRGARPLKIEIFEAQSHFDEAKTISCHSSDVPPEWSNLLEPFWACRWPAYQVRFAEESPQRVPLGYGTLDLGAMARHLTEIASRPDSNLSIHWNTPVTTPPRNCDLVVDTATGSAQRPGSRRAGVQQFFGQVFEFDEPHGVLEPIVMDGTVPQVGGFCFVYVLPMSAHRLLIEDTRLVPSSQSWEGLIQGVRDYVCRLGLQDRPFRVVHEEQGELPIPLCSFNRWRSPLRESLPGVIRAGFRAGFFHPTTGFSVPLALRSSMSLCQDIERARQTPDTPAALPSSGDTPQFQAFVRSCQQNWWVALIFNRFLLWSFSPVQAHFAFSYFYRLPTAFIQRFYGAQLRMRDLKAILTRWPPHKFSPRLLATHWIRYRLGLPALSAPLSPDVNEV